MPKNQTFNYEALLNLPDDIQQDSTGFSFDKQKGITVYVDLNGRAAWYAYEFEEAGWATEEYDDEGDLIPLGELSSYDCQLMLVTDPQQRTIIALEHRAKPGSMSMAEAIRLANEAQGAGRREQ